MRQQSTRRRLWCACAGVLLGSWSLSAGTDPGEIDWIRTFNSIGPAPTSALAIAADSQGNLYTAGSTGGVFDSEQGGQALEAFVRKYNAAGDEVWTRQFGTEGLPGDQAAAIGVDVSGVYVAGFASAALPGQTYAGGTDVFLRKYDLDGNESSRSTTRRARSPGRASSARRAPTQVVPSPTTSPASTSSASPDPARCPVR